MLLILGGSEVYGQKYPPIMPYRENDYSVAEVRSFAARQTLLSKNWTKESIAIANEAFRDANVDVVLETSDTTWIFDHIVYERRSLDSFINSRNKNGEIDFFPDDDFDGMVGVIKCNYFTKVLFKTKCINLLKFRTEVLKIEPVFVPVPTLPDSVVKEETPPPPKVRKLTSQEALFLDIETGKAYKKHTPLPEVNRNGWIKPVLITTGAVVIILAVVKFVLPLFCGGDPGEAPLSPPPIVPGGGGPGLGPLTK